ncbi:unnamed protein product [Auanema sp. JU1783]|nr:unnamed protein product [Auanema sp. JU1783]
MSSGYPPPPSMSMGDKPKKRRPSNTGSKLLDNQENYFLFSILGNDNICLSAAVVELLTCEDRHWKKKFRGVLCLVKDYVNRAYFLRIYNLISSREIWSFKLYKGFQVEVGDNCPELIFFESEDHKIYGFNFSSVEEARDFKVHFDKRREQETKSSNKGSAPLPPPQSSPYTPSSVRTPSIPLSGGVTPVGTMPHTDKASSSIGSSFFKKDKGKKKGKIKIKKEDISNPTNFQHKAHVGWDQDSGFSNNVFDSDPMDESIRDIIRAAGQDPTAMSKKTMKFVYDFIDKYQAEEVTESPVAQAPYKTPPPAVPVSQPTISQWSQPTPPPPPSRLSSHPSSQPPARPPPPPPSYIVDSSNRAARPLPQVPSLPSQVDTRPAVVPPPPPPPPPVAPVYNNSSSVPPPPPPPPVLSGSSGAVPPPPPPPTSLIKDLPAPQSGRSNLLAEIQAGKKLKSVGDPAEKVGAPNARGDMMAQIRQGTQLKHVDKDEEEKRKSAAPLSDMGGLAGALAKALEERRVNLGIDDSSEEEDSDDKNEWSD